jgi:ubiquinol oxidase
VQVRGLDENLFALNNLIISAVKGTIDGIYSFQDDGTLRHEVRRFYVLETVARVPYFAYLSVLHLRETFGERDLRDVMRLHYAEADNELHHLLVMESLGGNSSSVDRTLAKTMAFFYYWYVVGVYALSPEAAYHLSELIEDHAFQTYDTFLQKRDAELRGMPVPPVAREYYEADDKFLFDLVTQSCRTDRIDIAEGCPRRPVLETLHDVFVCIRNDEKEHWESLCLLVQRGETYNDGDSPIQSTCPEQVKCTDPALSPLALVGSAVVVGMAVALTLIA